MLKNTNKSYGLMAIALHWLVAVWNIGLFVLGLYMVDLGYYDDWYKIGPYWHRPWGVMLALVMVIRLAWRGFNPKPEMAGSAPIKRLPRWYTLLCMSGLGYNFVLRFGHQSNPEQTSCWAGSDNKLKGLYKEGYDFCRASKAAICSGVALV